MSKTQKKNHRRKYDRQQQRMKEEGVTEEQFNRYNSNFFSSVQRTVSKFR